MRGSGARLVTTEIVAASRFPFPQSLQKSGNSDREVHRLSRFRDHQTACSCLLLPVGEQNYASAYGPISDEGHLIPKIDPRLLRQQIPLVGAYRPGTIVVNVGERGLYLVYAGGVAIRYAVGVGREEALNFRGSAIIGRKAEWPRWSPTAA